MQSYHLTQWVLFFFIYSFIGWVWECCFVSVRKRRWVNRGFMYGPMLPIYGFGALAVLISTIRVRDSIPLIFLFGMVGATLLEYVTGAVMERLFNVKYWDYSNQKFNLNGYICLTSSLGWGLFSVLLVKFVHVPIEGAVLKIPTIIAEGIAFVLTVAAAVDVTQSFNDAMDLKRILAQLEESKKQIRKIQEKLKVASEEFVEDYRQRAGEFVEDYRRRVEEHVEDYRGRAEEMAEDYKKLAEELGVGEPTLRDIVKELEKPARDPRDEMPKPVLRTDVLDMKDLKEGMILKGTVRNVIDFGAFVDIGVHQDGLVHISEMTERYIKHPLEAVSVGDVVDVRVIGVDLKKKRISLSMKGIK